MHRKNKKKRLRCINDHLLCILSTYVFKFALANTFVATRRRRRCRDECKESFAKAKQFKCKDLSKKICKNLKYVLAKLKDLSHYYLDRSRVEYFKQKKSKDEVFKLSFLNAL